MTQILSRKELKARARGLLDGRYGFLASVFLLVTGSNLAMSFVLGRVFPGGMLNLFLLVLQFACTALMNILYYLLVFGQTRIFLKLCAGEPQQYSDLLFAFQNHPEPVAAFSVLQFVLQEIAFEGFFEVIRSLLRDPASSLSTILLWSAFMIFFVWLQLGLAYVPYLYNESPWSTFRELISKSWKLAKGQRWRLFVLQFSFIGINLLCALSFGIGLLFAQPYQQTTLTLFYRSLREEHDL